MIEIIIKENGKEQTYSTVNFVIAVDADTNNAESLTKLSAVHSESAAHLLASVLSVVGGAAQKLGTDIDGVLTILKEAHKFCGGMSVKSDDNFMGGGSNELN